MDHSTVSNGRGIESRQDQKSHRVIIAKLKQIEAFHLLNQRSLFKKTLLCLYSKVYKIETKTNCVFVRYLTRALSISSTLFLTLAQSNLPSI